MNAEPGHRRTLALLLLIGIVPFELNGWYNPKLASNPRAFWVVEVTTWALLPLAIVAYGIHRKLFTFADLGLNGAVRGRQMPGLVLLLLAPVAWCFYTLDHGSVDWARRIWPTNYLAMPFNYARVIPEPGPQTG
jgi:hypothetical protein